MPIRVEPAVSREVGAGTHKTWSAASPQDGQARQSSLHTVSLGELRPRAFATVHAAAPQLIVRRPLVRRHAGDWAHVPREAGSHGAVWGGPSAIPIAGAAPERGEE